MNSAAVIRSMPRLMPGGRQFLSSHAGVSRSLGNFYNRIVSSPHGRLARLDKPIGSWLLFLPSSWSICMAAPSLALGFPKLMLFAAGSVLLRGAGCTINDLWDRDIDKKVERTASRPIAAGEISPRQAAVFFCGQCLMGLPILLSMNETTIYIGVLSLIPVALYPLAKRFIGWPQLVLGLTFNFGVIMGWTAVTNQLDLPILPLYAGAVLWTQVYDTIYAHSDKKDDMHLNIGSSALVLGDRTKSILTSFSAAQYVLISGAGYAAGLPSIFPLLLIPGHAHLLRQVWFTDYNDPKQCISSFTSNRNTGLLILAAIVIAKWMQKNSESDEKSEDSEAGTAFPAS